MTTQPSQDAATPTLPYDPSFDRQGISPSAAADELLKRFFPVEGKDAAKPSDKEDEEKQTEQKPSDTEEPEDKDAAKPSDAEDDKEEEKTEDNEKQDDADDEAEVTIKVKVGDKFEEVPASKLARLHGQEAALTKRSMEVAERSKALDTKFEEAQATTQAILQRAIQRFEPFQKIDFNLLAASVARGEITEQEYTALRQSAQSAYEDVAFLQEHSQAFMRKLAEQKQAAQVETAKATIKALGEPVEKGGIEGWSEKLYDELRAFAVTQGVPADAANAVVDAPTIRMWHSAMLYERGRQKAKSNVTVTKVDKRPKKIVKTTNAPARGDTGPSEKTAGIEKRFRNSGNLDDLAELMIARASDRKAADE